MFANIFLTVSAWNNTKQTKQSTRYPRVDKSKARLLFSLFFQRPDTNLHYPFFGFLKLVSSSHFFQLQLSSKSEQHHSFS